MTRAVLLATNDASPLHLLYARYRLREDGVVVHVASDTGDPVCVGDDVIWNDVVTFRELGDAADIAILTGDDDPASLNESLVAWLRTHRDHGGITGAIGSAVIGLGAIDAIEGRTVTAPSRLRRKIEDRGGFWTGDLVSVDGTVVTGRDTGSLPFFMAAIRSDHAIPQDGTTAVATTDD